MESTEKRRSVRYACFLEAYQAGEQNESPRRLVRVLDVSTGGVRIHSPERLEPGSTFTVTILSSKKKSLGPLQVRVVHTIEQGDSTSISGAEFVDPIRDEDVDSLLS